MMKITNILQEIRLIGLRPAFFRIKQILQKKLGLDVRRTPIERIDAHWFEKMLPKDATAGQFLSWWRKQDTTFFIPPLDASQVRGDTKQITEKGRTAAHGRIRAFYGRELDFGWPINWYKDPEGENTWPKTHSLKQLTAQNKKSCGDIKNIWEIGRFLHVPHIVRAWAVSGDDDLMIDLMTQLRDFEAENPMRQGPHWVSEQEVAIRGAMLAYALYATKNASFWTDDFVLLFLRQIAATAEYCMTENTFAQICVRNNHFIGGALAPYIAAAVMPWHPKAQLWHDTAHQWLIEALDKQWHKDGGYTQPSHNYHRLALSYLLWALRIAEGEEDRMLSNAILDRLQDSFDLLRPMMLGKKGELPNWGPNDGALFCQWTDCDYADFRPLLSALSYALSEQRIFPDGPWDEELYWLWGAQACEAPTYTSEEQSFVSFPQAGLHMMQDDNLAAVLRAGPILSRYGQQADQLHVDLWWRGNNVFLDPGSYSYHDRDMHDWFRSTAAHNTICVDNQDQMTRYRQFLYLDWPKVEVFDLPRASAPIYQWAGGVHHGYMRLPEKVKHARLLILLNGGQGCVIVDRVSGRGQVDLTQNWILEDLNWKQHGKSLQTHDFAMCWESNIPITVDYAPSGRAWLSRYYGVRRNVPHLQLSSHLSKYTRQISVMWCGDIRFMPKTLKVNTAEDMIQCGIYTLPLPRDFLEN